MRWCDNGKGGIRPTGSQHTLTKTHQKDGCQDTELSRRQNRHLWNLKWYQSFISTKARALSRVRWSRPSTGTGSSFLPSPGLPPRGWRQPRRPKRPRSSAPRSANSRRTSRSSPGTEFPRPGPWRGRGYPPLWGSPKPKPEKSNEHQIKAWGQQLEQEASRGSNSAVSGWCSLVNRLWHCELAYRT